MRLDTTAVIPARPTGRVLLVAVWTVTSLVLVPPALSQPSPTPTPIEEALDLPSGREVQELLTSGNTAGSLGALDKLKAAAGNRAATGRSG